MESQIHQFTPVFWSISDRFIARSRYAVLTKDSIQDCIDNPTGPGVRWDVQLEESSESDDYVTSQESSALLETDRQFLREIACDCRLCSSIAAQVKRVTRGSGKFTSIQTGCL